MLRRTIIGLALIAVAATALAQTDTDPAHLEPPVPAMDAGIDASQGTLLVEDGSASAVVSARDVSVVVWEKRTPCFDRNPDSCLNSNAETSRTSRSLDAGSLTLQPREEVSHRSVLSVDEDGRVAIDTDAAEIGLLPEASTLQLSSDSDAPEDVSEAQFPEGVAVAVQEDDETDLVLEGRISLKTTGSVLRIEANDTESQPETIETGESWEQGDDGFYYRTVRLARASMDGALAAAWDGSLLAGPELPSALVASRAEVNVTKGQLAGANASSGPTMVEDLEVTITGINWEGPDEREGQLVVEDGTQPIAPQDPGDGEEEGVPTGTLLGAGSAAALTVLLTAYYWPRLSWLATVAVLPLYSRIEKDELFENEVREQLYDRIQDDPGVHAHALSESVGVGWGTTVYHLRRLERNGFVHSEKRGRYRRFFPASGFMERHREVLSVLQNETTNEIASLVRDQPGLNQSAICEELDISPSLANWHLNRLIDAELVDRERRGRTVHYTPGQAWDALEQIGGADAQEILGDPAAA